MNTLKQIVDPAFLRKSNYSYVDYDDTELSTVTYHYVTTLF